MPAGLLNDRGKPMPFIDKVVFSLEKEQIPYWNKFLQGYYDVSGITSDNFDQVVQMSGAGEPQLTDADGGAGHPSADLGVARPSSYMGFNMLDPVVGGDSERARKLRQAISNRDGPGRVHLDLSERPRHCRAGPDSARASSAIARARRASIATMYDWVDGAAAAQVDRGRAEAAGRGRLPERYRTARPASRCIINFDTAARGRGRQGMIDWLVKQFEQDQRAARRAQHRLQPLPGEDAQRHGADCTTGAGTPTTPIRRISCSCSTARRAR